MYLCVFVCLLYTPVSVGFLLSQAAALRHCPDYDCLSVCLSVCQAVPVIHISLARITATLLSDTKVGGQGDTDRLNI